MHKKLLAILVVFVFLVTSLGVISATDASNDISVKVVWNGDSTDEVTVNLLKDGQIVDTAKLNAENSWNTTFKVEDDGNYEVMEVISDDYSTVISGNAQSGFVINNILVKEDVLGTSNDETPLEDASNDELSAGEDGQILADDQNSSGSGTQGNGTGNSSSNNTTDDNSTDDNSTDDDDATGVDSADDDSGDGEKTTTTTITKTTTTKTVKEDKKNPENTTKTKGNTTGIPIIVLVVAVFVAVFIPLSRKK